jgi:hypothetical protein
MKRGSVLIYTAGVLKNPLFWGLFKYPEGHANAQIQGAQKPNREAYIDIR